MTTTETVPDVEVDESELTQQPCGTFYEVRPLILRWRPWKREPCPLPAVGEDLSTCPNGHVRTHAVCVRHITGRIDFAHQKHLACPLCGKPTWVVVSRLYTRRPA